MARWEKANWDEVQTIPFASDSYFFHKKYCKWCERETTWFIFNPLGTDACMEHCIIKRNKYFGKCITCGKDKELHPSDVGAFHMFHEDKDEWINEIKYRL